MPSETPPQPSDSENNNLINLNRLLAEKTIELEDMANLLRKELLQIYLNQEKIEGLVIKMNQVRLSRDNIITMLNLGILPKE